MKYLSIGLILVLIIIFTITRTAQVVGHKTKCAAQGIKLTGKPFIWEGGNTCIILKEPPKQPNKTPPKKHKWMI